MDNFITIEEIKERLGQNIPIEEICIEISKYLPFTIKSTMIETIIDSCLKEKDGIWIIDYLIKEMVINFMLCNNYSNLIIQEEEDIFDAYDYLTSTNVIDYILINIDKNELDSFMNIIDKELQQEIQVRNSFKNYLIKSLNKIIESTPNEKEVKKILKTAKKEFAKFDPNKLSTLNNILSMFGENIVPNPNDKINLIADSLK